MTKNSLVELCALAICTGAIIQCAVAATTEAAEAAPSLVSDEAAAPSPWSGVVEGDAQATAPKAPEPPFWALYEVDHGYLMPFVAIGADMASAVLVQDPAFTYLGLTPGFLTITKFSKTPCGPVKTVMYNPAGIFRKNNASWPSYEVSGGRTWSSNPACCGTGGYFPEPCMGARIEFKKDFFGVEDVLIYDPPNAKKPSITISGFRTAPFAIPFPNTTYWAYGILRWVLTDVAPVVKEVENGQPEVVGHVFDNYDLGPGSFSIAFLPPEGIQGPDAHLIKGFVSPLGIAFLKGTKAALAVTSI